MNLKYLSLGLVAAAALLAGSANAAAGAWVQVTPTTVTVDRSPIRSWSTTLASGTLVANPLVGSKKGCWSVDHRVTSFTGSTTADSLTIAGYPVSPSSVYGAANISTTDVAAALVNSTGVHATVTGQAQTIQPYLTATAGMSQTVTVVATEIGNCQR